MKNQEIKSNVVHLDFSNEEETVVIDYVDVPDTIFSLIFDNYKYSYALWALSTIPVANLYYNLLTFFGVTVFVFICGLMHYYFEYKIEEFIEKENERLDEQVR